MGILMLYTSYYNNSKNFPIGANIVSISYSITNSARLAIAQFDWKQYTPLAPPWSLVGAYKTGRISQSEYTEVYNKQISKLDINKVIADIGKDAILLCYEHPNDFCHRQLAANWVREHGWDIEEFDVKHQTNKILTSAFDF
jgi:hypothetical protein